MKLMSTYKVKIFKSNGAFSTTVEQYRKAVDFLIDVVLAEWKYISQIGSPFDKLRAVEKLTHHTTDNLSPKYNFDKNFYKFPSYLRACLVSPKM